MYQFLIQLLQLSTKDKIDGYGIILQQNTSVLVLQDLYDGSWGFSSSQSTDPSSSQNFFHAIQQVSLDTTYSPNDFIVGGPPCRYGTKLYWYAILLINDPPKLKNTRIYQDIQFMSRSKIKQKIQSLSWDVYLWTQQGMLYSCLNQQQHIYRERTDGY